MKLTQKSRLPGPNRRSERTILEFQLSFASGFTNLPPEDDQAVLCAIRSGLAALGAAEGFDFFCGDAVADNPVKAWPEMIAARFAQLALFLQQQAGHAVAEFGVHADTEDPVIWVWFEYDHVEVGERAAELALGLVRSALGLQDAEPGEGKSAVTEFSDFLKFSCCRAVPAETHALMTAAKRREIPCCNLDRYPFDPLVGDFRIRPNGLLRLGHASYKHILDGTFCLTRNAPQAAWLKDRQALRTALLAAGVPVPAVDLQGARMVMARHALRAARTLAVPVVIKPVVRSAGVGVSIGLEEESTIRTAVELARRVSSEVWVEAQVQGQCYRVLVVGGKAVAIRRDSQVLEQGTIHPAIGQQFDAVFRRWDLPIYAAEIITSDIGKPLDETNGAWVDLDLAPRLESWFPNGGAALDQVADLFLEQLFPIGSHSRVAIVSVTGTNGKTTTCTMIARILEQAERTPVVVGSVGVFLGLERQGSRHDFGPASAHLALEVTGAKTLVVEDYFGSILRFGFAYEWSDVAVCTNVTVDHLHRIGIHTLAQLAEVKFAPVSRARHGVVLNADNEYCAAMLARSTAKKRVAVSMHKDRATLAIKHGDVAQFCVLEEETGRQHIVLYDEGIRHSLVAVDDIPATLGGLATHNTSNAMHAAAAAWLLGIAPPVIRAALSSFATDYETCRGRLNEYSGLPFRVFMDYGHNADGFRLISAFFDRQKTPGRKIIMFGYSSDRRRNEVLDAVKELAGHFDLYVCRNFAQTRQMLTEQLPQLLQAGLIQCGVSEESTRVIENSRDALDWTLQHAQPEDLVLLLVGSSEFELVWQLLGDMRSAIGAQSDGLT
ncbi:MAG: Mur ligase family protein [Xanthomonadales bacterium]|nr:Mur ligase family protein [Xanthomonadales bacterium]